MYNSEKSTSSASACNGESHGSARQKFNSNQSEASVPRMSMRSHTRTISNLNLDAGDDATNQADVLDATNQADVLARRRLHSQGSKLSSQDSVGDFSRKGEHTGGLDSCAQALQDHMASVTVALEVLEKKLDQLISRTSNDVGQGKRSCTLLSCDTRGEGHESKDDPSQIRRPPAKVTIQSKSSSVSASLHSSTDSDAHMRACALPSGFLRNMQSMSEVHRPPRPWTHRTAPSKPSAAAQTKAEALERPPEPDNIFSEVPPPGPDLETQVEKPAQVDKLFCQQQNVCHEPDYKIARQDSRFSQDSKVSDEDATPRLSSRTPRQKPTFQRQESSLSKSSAALFEKVHSQLSSRVRKRSRLSMTIWTYLEDPETVPCGRVLVRLMTAMILSSVAVTLLRTVESWPLPDIIASSTTGGFDIVFAIEILVRFFVCPNRPAFFFGVYNHIDLVASCLALMLRMTSAPASLDSLRGTMYTFLACALPVLRLLKLLRRFETFHLLYTAFRYSIEVLPVLLFTLAIIVLGFSSLIYAVEPRSNVGSLSEALWLTIVTVGTVGYGDVVPDTQAGRILVACLITVSALYMAMPIGIVGNTFSQVWGDRDRLLLAHRTRRRFMSIGYTARDIPAMFIHFDHDADGVLSFQEFSMMMHELQLEMSTARLVRLFNSFDVDNTGGITDQQFVYTLFPAAHAEIYSSSLMQVTSQGYSFDGSPLPLIAADSNGSQDPSAKAIDQSRCHL